MIAKVLAALESFKVKKFIIMTNCNLIAQSPITVSTNLYFII